MRRDKRDIPCCGRIKVCSHGCGMCSQGIDVESKVFDADIAAIIEETVFANYEHNDEK